MYYFNDNNSDDIHYRDMLLYYCDSGNEQKAEDATYCAKEPTP